MEQSGVEVNLGNQGLKAYAIELRVHPNLVSFSVEPVQSVNRKKEPHEPHKVRSFRSFLKVCFVFDISVGPILSSRISSSHFIIQIGYSIVFLFSISFKSIYHARTFISRLNRLSINLIKMSLK